MDAETGQTDDANVADDLLVAALAVRRNAHVPYSHFAVGAALRTRSGRIFAGANVENAAYPEGICAEASAIGAMVSAGEREIVEVLTVAGGEHLVTCCGGCRQKLREFAGPTTRVHAADAEGVQRTFTMAELLPASFGREHVG
ncbi:MAG: cytidine deaminase [Ilumatobacteraceae bacterium]